MKARLLFSLALACLTGCPDENPPPNTDAGETDTGTTNPQLLIDPDPTTLALVEGNAPLTFTVRLSEDPLRSIAAMMTSADPSKLAIDPGSSALDSSNFSTGVTVTLSPQEDEDAKNESVEIKVETEVGSRTFVLTVVDDDAPNLVVVPLSVTLAEGGSATVDVSLSSAPAAAVSIGVASSDTSRLGVGSATLTFGVENWNVPQTIALSSLQDPDIANDNVDVTFTNPAGEGAIVAVTITDDDAQSFVVSASSLTIDEAGSDTFTVSLAAEPGSNVVVSIVSSVPGVASADPGSLTFTPANWDVAQTVTVAGVDDPNITTDSSTISISSVDVPGVARVAVSVIDDDTQIIEVTTASVTVTENGAASFGVRLGFAPTVDVTVSLAADAALIGISSTSLTFTPTDWDVVKFVDVSAPDDLDAADGATSIVLSAPDAGNVNLPVAIIDDDVLAILSDVTAVTIDEGTTAIVGVRLSAQPTSTITVSAASLAGGFGATPGALVFGVGNWDVLQPITIDGLEDVDLEDESDTLELTAPGLAGVAVQVTVLDDDTQGIVASTATVSVDENGSTTFDVVLAYQPSADVTVDVSSADPSLEALPLQLVFTPADWDQPQTVTVSALDDSNTTDEQIEVSLVSGAIGTTVLASVIDDDLQGIVVDTNALAIAEGASGTFTVQLAFEPATPIAIAVQSSDPGAASVAPAILNFDSSTWDTPQTVTVSGIADLDLANESVALTVSGGGLPDVIVTVTVTEDDGQAILLSGNALALDEGTSGNIGVSLAFQPAGDVAVAIASGDPSVTALPIMLLFTPANYDQPQPVTISAIHDPDLADESTVVTFSSAGLANATVAVTVNDDDAQSLVVSPTALSVGEGGSDSFSVSLAFQPAADVTVNIASQNAGVATVGTASLVFTPANYATPRTVTVSGVQDADVQDENVNVTIASAGLTGVTVAVTVVDDDILNLNVAPTSLGLTEGGAAGAFNVSLTQQPSGTVSVSIAASAAGEVILTPAALTFDGTNWNVPQSVGVAPSNDADALDENITLTVSAAGLQPRTVTVTIADDDTQALILSGNTLSLTEGTSGTITVRLAFDPVTPATVTLTSGDPAVTVGSASLTFTSANYSTPRSVAINAVQDADTRDENVNVTVASAVAASQIVAVSVTDDDTQALVLTTNTVSINEGASQAVGIRLAFDPVTPVTVTAASSDPGAVGAAPASFTFTSANYATPQNLTVSGVQDTNTVDESATVTVQTAVAASQTIAVSVNDDDTQVVAVNRTTATLAEGTTTTFTVRLGFDPITPATVSIGSSNTNVATVAPVTLTFTSLNFSVPQTVTITAPQDDDTQNNNATITVSSAVAPSRTVAVTVTDDDVQAIIVSANSLSIGEDGTGAFTARLAFNPLGSVTVSIANSDAGAATAAPLSLTFDAGNYDAPQNVAVNGVNDNDTADENLTLTLSGAGAPASAVVTVAVADDDVQALIVSQTSVTVAEGATNTSVTVRLAFNPVTSVTVNAASLDTGAVSVAPTNLTFTAANFSTPRPLTIGGVQDLDLANEATTVRLTSAVATTVDVSVGVTDDDTQALIVAPLSLNVPEGGNQSFTVRLAFIPGGNVSVGVASNDTGVATVSTPSVNFTPATYDQLQVVVVSGVQDIDLVDENTTVAVTSAGVAAQSVAVAVQDEDTQAFTISPTTLSLTEGGASGTFNVSLQFQPTGPVTVSVLSSDAQAASAAPTTLTFDAGNFGAAQPVTVSPVTDVDTRDESVTITVSSAAVPVPGTVDVSVTDDDDQALVISANALTVTEQGPVGQFTVALAFAPDGPTAVTVASPDTGAVTVAPTTLNFDAGNYATPRTVNVTGVSDPDVVDELVNVAITTAIAPAGQVAVTVDDDDTQSIVVSTTTVNVNEGAVGSFTVRLAFQPATNTTVTVVSNDPAVATVNAASFVFTPVNWNTARAVNVTGAADTDQLDESTTITVASAGLPSRTIDVNVTDDDDQTIIVNPGNLTVTEGQNATFTVRLGFVPLAATEVVTLSSSDPGAATVTPPLVLTFDANNFATPVTVTVHGEIDADIVDESVTVTLDSGAPATPNRTVAVTVSDPDVMTIEPSDTAVTLTEGGPSATVGVNLSNDPSGSLSVTVTSLDTGAVSRAPATLAFNSGNYNVEQDVTLSPVNDDDVRDETVQVRYSAPNVANQFTTVTVQDDDTQAIVTVAGPLTVAEGASINLNVRLAFRPTNPITVTVGIADATAASASPTSLVFDSTNFAVNQPVTISGSQDANLDNEATQLTLSTGAVPAPEGAADVVIALNVTDDDEQFIIVQSIPGTLPTSVQEGGPGVPFSVSLGFPPRLSENGGTDTVAVTSTLAGIAFGPANITFGQANFATPVRVTVTAADDANMFHHQLDAGLAIAGEVSTTFPVQVIDDEDIILATANYPTLTGGTLATVRHNIRWGSTRLGVVGFDNGETTIASNTRELDDLVLGPAIATGGGGNLSAEAIEFDGTSFRYFVTSSGGIDYAASDETADATFLSQSAAPSGALNFWPAWNGTNAFGLVYRENGAVSDRLRFRIVQQNGTLSSPTALTIVDGSDDVQPNAHFTGAGYTVIYSSGFEVRCLRTNASGVLIPGSDAVLAGFPAQGAFVSSVWDGSAIVVAYYNATNSINLVRVTPACTISGSHAVVGGPNVFLSSPPAVDWNGTEIAVAYDYIDNNQDHVGVLLVTPALGFRGDFHVGLGERPSISWAGDRWALRYGNPVVVTVGSFQFTP